MHEAIAALSTQYVLSDETVMNTRSQTDLRDEAPTSSMRIIFWMLICGSDTTLSHKHLLSRRHKSPCFTLCH